MIIKQKKDVCESVTIDKIELLLFLFTILKKVNKNVFICCSIRTSSKSYQNLFCKNPFIKKSKIVKHFK